MKDDFITKQTKQNWQSAGKSVGKKNQWHIQRLPLCTGE
jgi:hypothetical protein